MNIALIGMMGSGKTTVGKEVSKGLSYKFIDTDEYIEKKEQMTLRDIIKFKGENYFRDIESEAIRVACKSNNSVISTGGGCVLKPENIKNLKENSDIWYLKCRLDMIETRTTSNSSRYLLYNTSVYDIYQERKELYERYSDYIVDSSDKSIQDICKIIINNEL